jgi:nucleotide-binding universal stress UspA family protein
MEKQILLALDDSIHSRHALQYVARIFAGAKDFACTLYHVLPQVLPYVLDDMGSNAKAGGKLKALMQQHESRALSALRANKQHLVELGIPERSIDILVRPQTAGLARDILNQAENHFYDAIVVGRHGRSSSQEDFMGGVSAKLLEHSTQIPVWVVDGEVTSSKVMVAVDGSENSIKAIGFLCFILEENPKITYTLYHISQDERTKYAELYGKMEAELDEFVEKSHKRLIDRFSEQAYQQFQAIGVPERQVEMVTARPSLKTGQMILDEAQRGGYGTVVIGRRGLGRAHFFGSSSRFVAERLKNRALWLVS